MSVALSKYVKLLNMLITLRMVAKKYETLSMYSKKEKIGLFIIVAWGFAAMTALIVLDPISQDNNYHNFSDSRFLFMLPNTLNVLSNIPFLIIGAIGVVRLREKQAKKMVVVQENSYAYYALFIGVSLVAFGSGYYHLWPNNATLLWDRLPMTIAFMGLVSIVVGEYISIKIGRMILFPCVVFGVVSVLYWHYTETSGEGDLRPYIFVQFFPMGAIPIVLLFFRSLYSYASGYWFLLGFYVIAKIFEFFDPQIHEALSVVSGHSIKHLAAAMGVGVLLFTYERRVALSIDAK